eukprot:342653-Rhodomonas_salina.3
MAYAPAKPRTGTRGIMQARALTVWEGVVRATERGGPLLDAEIRALHVLEQHHVLFDRACRTAPIARRC